MDKRSPFLERVFVVVARDAVQGFQFAREHDPVIRHEPLEGSDSSDLMLERETVVQLAQLRFGMFRMHEAPVPIPKKADQESGKQPAPDRPVAPF